LSRKPRPDKSANPDPSRAKTGYKQNFDFVVHMLLSVQPYTSVPLDNTELAPLAKDRGQPN